MLLFAVQEKTTMARLSKQYDDALAFAADLQHSQARNGGGIRYAAHLLSVSIRVLSAGGTEVLSGLLARTRSRTILVFPQQ
jgi:hypothetical protein